MAEYFPLLDRAVSGLPDQSAEARRSVYDRARTALLGQLRGMDPPIPDDDIARESTALDEAIARVEAKFAEHKAKPPVRVPPRIAPPAIDTPPPRLAPAPRDAAARVPSSAARPGAPSPAGQPAAGQPAAGQDPSIAPPPVRERPVLGPRPAGAGALPRPAIPPRTSAARDGVAPSRPVGPDLPGVPPAGLPPAGALPARGQRPVMALRPVAAGGPEPSATRPADAILDLDEAAARPADLDAARTPPASADEAVRDDDRAGAAARSRDAAARPAAPRPAMPRRFGWPTMAGALLVAALMIGIGITAWLTRDRPEQVVATQHGVTASTGAAPGKIVERAAPAGTDPSAAADATPNDASSDAAAPAPQTGGTDASSPGIAVAQRAALLVDAPDDPQHIKTYTGTVVWHVDSVSPGQGQPLSTAIKADIDIPDAKLKVTMLLQKNPEPQLPASHTIELHFLPQPGNTLGNVKQVNVPEMRKDDDAPTGDPLAGVPVAITENYFLVGLSRGAAEAQNMRLITERNWFDMSVLFTSNKLGKLTFEKGAAGQRIIADALAAWKDNH